MKKIYAVEFEVNGNHFKQLFLSPQRADSCVTRYRSQKAIALKGFGVIDKYGMPILPDVVKICKIYKA